MRCARLRISCRWLPGLLLLAWASSGCQTVTVGEVPDAGVPDGPRIDRSPFSSDQSADAPPATACRRNSDCKQGYCVNGSCCPTQAQVCGLSCCDTTQTCFANACVVPGNLCYSNADCKSGEYCEPGVVKGGQDAGPRPDGRTCLKAAPRVGRCLALPARCPATDAGAPKTDAGCVPTCEYRPPTLAQLQAVPKWTWGPFAREYKNHIDVWSTPAVGRIYDTNCDGRFDELDPPVVVFVSGDAKGTCCSCGGYKPSTCLTGVLRVLDGETGGELWSLRAASSGSIGFAGVSVALGDVDRDGRVEIMAVTGEGKIVQLSHDGKVERTSDKAIPEAVATSFGWGGALSLADTDADSFPEVAYGSAVFRTKGALTRAWVGGGGIGGAASWSLSTFADVDGAADGHLELVAGNTAYKSSGAILWRRTDLGDGLVAIGDFNRDKKPEVVTVSKRVLNVLDGATGQTVAGPLTVAGSTSENGGPPTVADFDGDGQPEVGIAMRQYYYVFDVDMTKKTLSVLWKTENHDLSSSVTGSTVFDFEGDGRAEVVYNDECFLWVYDGKTGAVRFATPTTSFTATEASLVADVDGDGKAEMLMVSNGADPTQWSCNKVPWNVADPKLGRPAWKPPSGASVYRGITLWEDKSNSWVGTRTLWNQHTYHVTNVCDNRDSACSPPNFYGLIPQKERKNWEVSWLNNFRQNVQDKGIFDAPDATVSIKVECTRPVLLRGYLRNQGIALLPAGVEVGFYVQKSGSAVLLGKAKTSSPLFPGQVAEVTYTTTTAQGVTDKDSYQAKVLVDPLAPAFHECRADNNTSAWGKAQCLQ